MLCGVVGGVLPPPSPSTRERVGDGGGEGEKCETKKRDLTLFTTTLRRESYLSCVVRRVRFIGDVTKPKEEVFSHTQQPGWGGS